MERYVTDAAYVSSYRRGHGKIGFFDLAATVSASWKKLSPDCKQKYEELARLDKIRFEREMEEYKATSLYLAEMSSAESATAPSTLNDLKVPNESAEGDFGNCAFVDTDTLETSPSPFTIESMGFSAYRNHHHVANKNYDRYNIKPESFNSFQASTPGISFNGQMARGANSMSRGLRYGLGHQQAMSPLPPSHFCATRTGFFDGVTMATKQSFGVTQTPPFRGFNTSSFQQFNSQDDLEPTPFAPLESGNGIKSEPVVAFEEPVNPMPEPWHG